jgi:hypothetical protein
MRTKKSRRTHLHGTRRAGAGWALVVLGAVALTVGLTGGAGAAALITGAQIKDGTVAGVDVKDAGLNGLDVRDDTLTTADYDGDVTSPRGPRGDQGAPGADGVEVVGYAISPLTTVGGKKVGTADAFCDPGQIAIGGGVRIVPSFQVETLDSAPFGVPSPLSGAGWTVRVENPTSSPAEFFSFAVCAEVK